MSKYTQFGENRKNFIKSSRVRAIYPPFYFCFLSSFCVFLAVIATSRLFAALIAASFVFVEMSLLMMVFCSILPIFPASSSSIIFSTRRSAGFCDIILSEADECAFAPVPVSFLRVVGKDALPICRFTNLSISFLIGVAVISISSPFFDFLFYLFLPYLPVSRYSKPLNLRYNISKGFAYVWGLILFRARNPSG